MRDDLEARVGDRGVFLLDALADNPGTVHTDPWLNLGVRTGLVRMSSTRTSVPFIDELHLSEEERLSALRAWCFPFAKNSYGQFLIAQAPGWPSVDPFPEKLAKVGAHSVRIFCVADLSELAALASVYRGSHR